MPTHKATAASTSISLTSQASSTSCTGVRTREPSGRTTTSPRFPGESRSTANSASLGIRKDDSSQHVFFSNGHIQELYLSPDPGAQWKDNDLTALAGGSPAGGILNGYPQNDGSQHVNYVALGGSGHVHQLYRSPDAQWVDSDLTALSGGTPAVGSAFDGYSQDDNSQHVNFIDADGHVHELYLSPEPAAQWVDNDLTKLAGGTPASLGEGPGSGLDGYSQNDGSQHVNFIDADGHVHELYRSPESAAQWKDNDLTALSGGTPALFGSPLDGYSQDDNSQHVNFIDADGHIHELYIKP